MKFVLILACLALFVAHSQAQVDDCPGAVYGKSLKLFFNPLRIEYNAISIPQNPDNLA